MDTGHNDQDDLPTFQEEGLSLKSYISFFFFSRYKYIYIFKVQKQQT